MKNFLQSFPLTLTMLFFLVSFNNCGVPPQGFNSLSDNNPLTPHGTEIGNPDTSHNYASTQIINTICGVLTACNKDLTMANCETGVMSADGVAARLGLTASNTISSFEDIQKAELAGAVIASLAPLTNCVNVISNIDCTSASVVGAYNTTSDRPFSNLYMIIPDDPATCGSVYQSP